jgi:hypothetical protein
VSDRRDDTEEQVRSMLRARAAGVRVPGGDAGLDAIQRKLDEAPALAPPRRAPRAPWLAAAAAVVVAVVGGTLITSDDADRDRTVVAGPSEGDGEPGSGGGFAAYPTLDAVWPTDDPEQLRGISAAWARDDSPLDAARLYLEDRLGADAAPSRDSLTVAGNSVRSTGDVDVTVHLERLDGDVWYVRRATTGLLAVDATFDGARVKGTVVPSRDGELEIAYAGDGGGSGGNAPGVAGQPVPLDAGVPDESSIVLRVTQGGAALHEERLVAQPGSTALGVWPKPADQVAGEDLVDPVDTAVRYLMDAAGVDGGVELSDFRQGDANSGEVEVTGDIVATIALRQVEGRWHVEAVHSPLVEARGDAPGELWLHANVEGVLTVTVLDPWGTVVQSMPEKHMGEGEEVVVVPAEPVHKPFTVRYRFEPVDGTAAGLGDVAVAVASTIEEVTVGDPGVHEVPDEAVFAAGGLDPIGTVQGYIEARLGFIPDDVRLDDGDDDASDRADRAKVDWSGGSVFLVLHDGYWYVTDAFGPTIEIPSMDLPSVQVRVGEPGVVLVQALDAEGGVCAETSADVDGGGLLTVDLGDVPCDVESIVAVLNELIAERPV